MNTNKGFTFIELMITVAIISIMLTVGLPSFKSTVASNRLTSTTNEIISALQLAKSEAIKQHKTVVIRKKNNNWANGWEVFVDDLIENKIFDSGETVLVVSTFDSLNSTVNIVSTYPNYISFTATGRANAGHFTFCSGKDYRSIIIAMTGRIRTSTITSCI
ncbi:MAG: GspH/FimT family pseudopilin [Methylococcales bacterium]|nr:GspH/FimT family pseudopilin [Methylococcales bacterium]